MKKVIGLILGVVCCIQLLNFSVSADTVASLASEDTLVTTLDGETTSDSETSQDVSETEETTVTADAGMSGQFETRVISDEDYIQLDKIKAELAGKKSNKYSGVASTIAVIAGVILALYTVVILLAFLFDKLNIFGDIEAVRIVTFNHAMTLHDEDAKDYAVDKESKVFILTNKSIITSTIAGILLSGCLINATKLFSFIEYMYTWLSTAV